LLAKLYAEQLISAYEMIAGGKLPDNIPDLMLSYLNELNRNVTGDDKLDDRTVQQDAKAIAWKCLKQTLRPAPVKREDAIAAFGGEDAEARLKYLEERLRLIQTIGVAQDQIRFALDPLAEYLAGLYLIERFGKDEAAWQMFLQQAADKEGAPDTIKGFLLALRDCYLAIGLEGEIPDSVAKELAGLPDLSHRLGVRG
jgi:hypothetical protein